jgi:hypothetical protein
MSTTTMINQWMEPAIPANDIRVPDLWYIAQDLKKTDPDAGAQVLACWHLCLTLLQHIEDNDGN